MKHCKCDSRWPGCEHGLPCPGGPIYSGNGGLCPDCAERVFSAATRRFIAGLRRRGIQVENITRRVP